MKMIGAWSRLAGGVPAALVKNKETGCAGSVFTIARTHPVRFDLTLGSGEIEEQELTAGFSPDREFNCVFNGYRVSGAELGAAGLHFTFHDLEP